MITSLMEMLELPNFGHQPLFQNTSFKEVVE